MSVSFYNVLEVPETATHDEIKKSYRKLSMIHHPDKPGGDKERFQKISEAYETLSDQDKKREYDMRNQNPFMRMGSFSQDSNSNVNSVEEMLANLFMNGGGGGMPFSPFGNMFAHQGMGQGMGQGMPNIQVFHNGIPVNIQQGLQKPTPIIKTLDVPIDKILTGTTLPVEIERWTIIEGNKVFEKETIYITVPKGVDDGEILILRDKGNSMRDDCKGDIKMFIKIENNTDFKRVGLDLIIEKTISVKEALCGFSFELKYITGKNYTITNNSGNIISNGYKKIIPNMGFSRDEHTGSLIIVFNVTFPEKLSEKSIESLKVIDF